MIVAIDTEFLDDGDKIHLISMGLVAEDGRTLYRINEQAPWHKIAKHDWLMNNVIPHLPTRYDPERGWDWEYDHPEMDAVVPRERFAAEVEKFLLDTEQIDGRVKTWAYVAACDHVCLYQLFGSLTEAMHHGVPMRTSCLRQELSSLKRFLRLQLHSNPSALKQALADFEGRRPVQNPESEHHALFDAQHDMDLAGWLGLTKVRTGHL